MTETVTSTLALSQTLLLSSGANAWDVGLSLAVAVSSLVMFVMGVLFVCRWVPLR